MKSIIEQFIPIIFIFILLAYPKTVVKLSHSILGRLIAVLVIIFYSSIDKYLGLLVCGLTIFYYQMDYVEGMLAEMNENFDNILETTTPLLNNIPKMVETTKNNITTLLNNQYQQFTYYQDLYNETPKSTTHTKVETKFRENNCDKDGNITHKNSIIKLDVIEHLFPEIKFSKGKCNPCDNNCGFTILEKRLMTEEKMKPISTFA